MLRSCRDLDLELRPGTAMFDSGPGTTRSRHRFIAEEIYFAVSKIRRFPGLRHGLKRESPEVFSKGGPGLIDTLWMTDQTADVCETRYSKGSQLVQSGAQ